MCCVCVPVCCVCACVLCVCACVLCVVCVCAHVLMCGAGMAIHHTATAYLSDRLSGCGVSHWRLGHRHSPQGSGKATLH